MICNKAMSNTTIEKDYIGVKINQLYNEMLNLLKDLQDSASYWSEYDVPIGIVEQINEVIEKSKNIE